MSKVVLSSEELFFLAKIMKAEYLDYDYVAMMQDLSHRLGMVEATAMDGLNDKGLIFEDFGGDIEVEDLAKELIEPIFFGKFESEMVIGDASMTQKYKYHVHEGRYVQVGIEGKKLTIQTIDKEDILSYMPYCEELASPVHHPINYFEGRNVDGILVLKRQRMGGSSKVIQLVNDGGIFYQAKRGRIYSLTKAELKALIQKTLWEE